MGLSINDYHVPDLSKLAPGWHASIRRSLLNCLFFMAHLWNAGRPGWSKGFGMEDFLLQKVLFRDFLAPDKTSSINNILAQSGHQFPHVDLGNPSHE